MSSASTAPSGRPARSRTASTPGVRCAPHGEGQGGGAPELAEGRRLRPRRLDRLLRQPHRPAVPRGGRQPRRRQPRSRAARGSLWNAAGRCASSASSHTRSVGACSPALLGIPLVLGAGAASGQHGVVRPKERIAALGFSEGDTATLDVATSSTPSPAGNSATGSLGSTGSRRCPTCGRTRARGACTRSRATSAGTATARSAT